VERGHHPRWLAVRAFLLIVAVALALVATRAAKPLVVEGRVDALTDGDTIIILEGARVQQKVRIAGIDAPERGKPLGRASREHLS
jgi:endonuclease YncB( thermonuclease family)